MTIRPGYQVKEPFLNVYSIKDKPQILYFNLFLIVNIMNNYFTWFVRVNGHFMTLKELIMVFYYLGGITFCLEELYVTCAQLGL